MFYHQFIVKDGHGAKQLSITYPCRMAKKRAHALASWQHPGCTILYQGKIYKQKGSRNGRLDAALKEAQLIENLNRLFQLERVVQQPPTSLDQIEAAARLAIRSGIIDFTKIYCRYFPLIQKYHSWRLKCQGMIDPPEAGDLIYFIKDWMGEEDPSEWQLHKLKVRMFRNSPDNRYDIS